MKHTTRSLPKDGDSILKTQSFLKTLTHTKVTRCRDLVCSSGRYDVSIAKHELNWILSGDIC